MSEVEMVIDSIRVSLMNYQRVVILKEKEGERYLPCWIGPAEADAIVVKIQGVSVPRPLTHDFTCSAINALGGSVKSVVIDKLENDTFYAKIILESGGKQIEIDCRPSDALAVALRANAAIFADEKVLSKAGILLDAETGKPIGAETTYGEEVVHKGPGQVEAGKLGKFPAPVREIFALAEEQARRLSGKYIGTGHLLFALIKKAPNTASNILGSLGVNPTELLSAVKLSIDKEQPSELDRIALNDSAKKTIQLGLEEARRLASPQVLPEHLLIGMLREDTGEAGKILRGHGINVDKVYAELIRFYNQARLSEQSQENLSKQESDSWQLEMEALNPHKCPRCKQKTLFWNRSSQLFECHNKKCKRRFTAEEFRNLNPDIG